MTDHVPGTLFIVAAPSGGGKTSLVHWLTQNISNINVSVSHTTRMKRPGEEEGINYYFISEEQFAKMIEGGAFIEHAQVFSHWYGTSVQEIEDRLNQGIDVLLDIDWQGALQIKQKFADAVSIFIIPPSLEVLKQRLENRQQDNESVIAYRMQKARDEMSHYIDFDYLIVNDEFEQATLQLQSIIIAHRLSIKKQSIRERKLLSFLLSPQ